MRRLTSLLFILAIAATPMLAQQQGTAPVPNPNVQTPTPPAQAPRAETPRAPSLGASPMPAATNIRIALSITDNYTGAPVKKEVSLILLSGHSGMVRTQNYSSSQVVLNVDALAQAYQGGMVSVRLTFEYTPERNTADTSANRRSPSLNESITVVLQDGKPLMVSQSADPATDRKVTAELTATILK